MSCSSVLGRVEGRGSRTEECLESLHRFLPRGTPPVTLVQCLAIEHPIIANCFRKGSTRAKILQLLSSGYIDSPQIIVGFLRQVSLQAGCPSCLLFSGNSGLVGYPFDFPPPLLPKETSRKNWHKFVQYGSSSCHQYSGIKELNGAQSTDPYKGKSCTPTDS